MDCPNHCLNQNLPPQACNIEPPCKPHCPELVVTTSAVLFSIRKLDVNKAGGSSLITNRLLKIAGTTVIYPLMRPFNLLLSTGKFPTASKKDDVVSVPKKGGSAFRPISLLPPLSKLFEKLLADHISHFMNSNRLFSDTQFGFRKQRSTEMQLLQMSHKWMQVLPERKEAAIVCSRVSCCSRVSSDQWWIMHRHHGI
ncbi:hypothetical protein RvY_05880 [Ramazzottius varieornatus]|uniref:Uncharacterized protein n=1 Tax=Ramazzottius varieornatus TaxID=947166 RepID=A0A1D1V054_RAMVA|nr:hypothetical protein RvY_05880 [Ramazzottius varieornatus]